MATAVAPRPSTFAKILDKARATRQQAAQQALTSYRDLVTAVAAKDYSPTEPELDLLVENLDQFQVDVARVKERHRLAGILASEPRIKEERERAFIEMTAARDAFDAHAKEHAAAQKDRLQKLGQIDARIRECDRARQLLRQTATPSNREAQIIERLQLLCAEERELAEQLDPRSSTKNVAVFLGQCDSVRRPGVQQRFDATKSRHAAVREEIAALRADRESLDDTKLLP